MDFTSHDYEITNVIKEPSSLIIRFTHEWNIRKMNINISHKELITFW